ncbi:sulfite exporter TauE/SafE family protein [Effusibacillus lacus]|uniref:Urease accessory protein UreH n=1 Tax=Effusibacillus lacus TaxID=1348429 RepID=A0A292YRG1_9BACL|nr:sulfite exporter TauE/SafE family protein [Effusibacillus lacus]TCS76140.1 ABC-type nickel/cobalt efflux system permease component RcnA [Effusibacillus lacus]GAX91353.1 urease accessory protein UreH [Effusibacillus lacus]
MEMNFLTILTIGFILGIKHALEPDHVIAVSTIASHSRKLWRSSLAGVFWGIGHTATLFVVGLFFLLFKNEIPRVWEMSLEMAVGIMLVYLGASSLLPYRKKKVHVHEHEHDGMPHKHFHSHQVYRTHNHDHKDVSYVRSMIIGLVHGMAGSAAMLILTMSTAQGVLQGALYILIFGGGTVIGMLLFTTLIGIPFVLSVNKIGINRTLTRITGLISTAYGIYYIYDLGVTEGLFRIWLQ